MFYMCTGVCIDHNKDLLESLRVVLRNRFEALFEQLLAMPGDNNDRKTNVWQIRAPRALI